MSGIWASSPRVAVGFLLFFTATPLLAADPVYFHKADVERDLFVADYSRCEELAGGVNAPPAIPTYATDIYSVAANSFFNGFFRSREKRHKIENVLRTCMADKGYRRVRASKQTVGELKRLPDKERVDRLFVLASAPVPEGKVLPR